MSPELHVALEVGHTCYLRVMGERFLSKVLGVAENTIWVSFPGKDYPQDGMGVEVEFHDLEGLLVYHTRVAIGPKQKNDGIVLERSEAATYMKHRRSWRVEAHIKADVSLDGAHWAGELIDLSGEGALLRSVEPCEVGDIITVSFALPQQPEAVIPSKVIRSTENEDDTFTLALRFSEIPRSVKPALTWYLYKCIRKQHANELRDLYPRSGNPPRPGKDRQAKR